MTTLTQDKRPIGSLGPPGPRAGQVWMKHSGERVLVLGTGNLWGVEEGMPDGLVFFRSIGGGAVAALALEVFLLAVTDHSTGLQIQNYQFLSEERFSDPHHLDQRLQQPLEAAAAFFRANGQADSPESATALLEALHASMRENASDLAQAYARGVLAGLFLAGRIDRAALEDWRVRLHRCPGHPSGLAFCCYCGVLGDHRG